MADKFCEPLLSFIQDGFNFLNTSRFDRGYIRRQCLQTGLLGAVQNIVINMQNVIDMMLEMLKLLSQTATLKEIHNQAFTIIPRR